jgi:SMC interacting uncharacterized protein involved in chromosome segregation
MTVSSQRRAVVMPAPNTGVLVRQLRHIIELSKKQNEKNVSDIKKRDRKIKQLTGFEISYNDLVRKHNKLKTDCDKMHDQFQKMKSDCDKMYHEYKLLQTKYKDLERRTRA